MNGEYENNFSKEENDGREIKSENNIQKDCFVIYGKLSYGNRTKNYGLISIIFDITGSKIVKTSAVLSSRRDISNFNFNQSIFQEELKKLVSTIGYGDSDFQRNLAQSLDNDFLNDLLDCISDKEQVKEKVKELIENILQEQINLDAVVQFSSKNELNDIFPELFPVEEDIEEVNQSNSGELNTGKLNLDIKLNSIPVISAVKGKRIVDLRPGDQIFVKVNDKREISGELLRLLKQHNEEIIAEIVEISFKEDSERYSVLVKLKSNIYGTFVVDKELKIKVNQINSEEVKQSSGVEINQDFIIMALIGTMIFIVIFIVLFIFKRF